jgi:hypothetical protein
MGSESVVPNPSINTVRDWKYADSVTQSRRDVLAQPGSFEELVRLVTADARDIRVYASRGSDRGLTHCIQPVFNFELPDTGDALFNGPWGYRAQYWASPWQGLAANGRLLANLASKLLGAIDIAATHDLAKRDVCASLHAASAKIWIQEIPSLLIEPTIDLDVEPWVTEAKHGVELARWGISAPCVTKFQVKGALLDPYNNEVVPTSKIKRHHDIHHYGFS